MLHDPVCGRRIKRNQAYARVTHERVTYYLCCPICQAEFAAAPERYADPTVGEAARGPGEARQHSRHINLEESGDPDDRSPIDGRARPRRKILH
jgi:YHS domain-containing protein